MYCSILQKQVQIHNSSTVSRIDYKVTTSFITKKKHLCFIGWNVNPNVDIYNLELIVSNKSMLLKELVIFTLYKAIRNLINYSLMPFLRFNLLLLKGQRCVLLTKKAISIIYAKSLDVFVTLHLGLILLWTTTFRKNIIKKLLDFYRTFFLFGVSFSIQT